MLDVAQEEQMRYMTVSNALCLIMPLPLPRHMLLLFHYQTFVYSWHKYTRVILGWYSAPAPMCVKTHKDDPHIRLTIPLQPWIEQ